ncbi:histidine phosphatase family protein [Actinomyces sp. F1_1611]
MKKTFAPALLTGALLAGALAGCTAGPSAQSGAGEQSTPAAQAPQSNQSGANSCDTTVLLVRHAQTEANVAGEVSGWSETDLTEKGVQQARAAGQALAGTELSAVLTSDLSRAERTAELILEEGGSDLTPVPVPELREQNYGGFDGGSDLDLWLPIMEKMGYPFDESKSDPGDFWGNPDALDWYSSVSEEDVMNTLAELDPSGEAEDWDTYQQRISQAVAQVARTAEEHACETVLVVSHGGTITTMLGLMDPEGYGGESVGNASISELSYRDGQFSVQRAGVDPADW